MANNIYLVRLKLKIKWYVNHWVHTRQSINGNSNVFMTYTWDRIPTIQDGIDYYKILFKRWIIAYKGNIKGKNKMSLASKRHVERVELFAGCRKKHNSVFFYRECKQDAMTVTWINFQKWKQASSPRNTSTSGTGARSKCEEVSERGHNERYWITSSKAFLK